MKRSMLHICKLAIILVTVLLLICCSKTELDKQTVLMAKKPLHLEDHLDATVINGSHILEDQPKKVEWLFDDPQPEWKPVILPDTNVKPLEMIPTEDSLRLFAGEATRGYYGNMVGGQIYTELSDLKHQNWAHILVRARTSEKNANLFTYYNVTSTRPSIFEIEMRSLINDGEVHTYTFGTDYAKDPWIQLGLGITAEGPASVDILSISVVSKEAIYADLPVGVKTEKRRGISHPVLYMHAPGKLHYRIKIPDEGRLDFRSGVLRNDVPVIFRVSIKQKSGAVEKVFEETIDDKLNWDWKSVDLSAWKGRTITLTLEADSERSGTVALWAAPTIRGKRSDKRPNFMVIILDGLRADHLAAYGYHRNTAPNIEKKLDQCLIFKNAFSQAAATPGSTVSLFTSTYTSVHGVHMPEKASEGLTILERLPTLAEVLKESGYYTKAISLTSWITPENGYGEGFEDFEFSWDMVSDNIQEPINEAQLAAERINDFLNRDLKQPFFLYVHMLGPHWPYDPPEEFNIFQNKDAPLPPNISVYDKMLRGEARRFLNQLISNGKLSEEDVKYLIDRYDGGIYQSDAALALVLDEIKSKGLHKNSMIIITADHGEQLMDHGWIGHWQPFNDTLHIPLIINYPPLFKKREFRDYPVESIDIGPTILSAAKIKKPVTFKGENILAGKGKGYAVSDGGSWWKIQNLEWSLIYHLDKKKYELYDLQSDPGELYNIADQHSDIVEKLTTQIKKEIKSSITKVRKVELDAKTIERLKTLGYIK